MSIQPAEVGARPGKVDLVRKFRLENFALKRVASICRGSHHTPIDSNNLNWQFIKFAKFNSVYRKGKKTVRETGE